MFKKYLSIAIALIIILSGANALNQPTASYAMTDNNPFSMSDKVLDENLKKIKEKSNSDTYKLSKSSLMEEKQKAKKIKEQESIAGKKYIVKFDDNVSLQTIYDVVSTYKYKIMGKSEQRLFTVRLTDLEQFKLQSAGMIEYIEQDNVMKIEAVPNDSYYSYQWGPPAVNMPNAWDITKGSDDIFVAVIDSGIDRSHPDFASEDIRAGYDFILGGSCDFDYFGHGTNVTGIIGAATNNSSGIAGVNWDVSIIPLCVVELDGYIYDSDVIQAINVAAEIGCDVINLSFGGFDYSSTLNSAIQNAISKGCIVVASAGNEGNSSYMYPASCDGVVSVGSVDSDLSLSDFSQYNNKVDIVGPGSFIYTTADPYFYGSYYEYVDGTSFSAPHVSGIAALAAACDPTLTPAKFQSLLQTTSTDLGAKGYDNYYGYGLINAGEIMRVITNPPAVPNSLTTSITGSRQCTLKWNAVSGTTSYNVYRATSATGTYTKLATVTSTNYPDNSVTSGSTYWYKVNATNAAGTSAQSSAVSVKIAVPEVPGGITTSVTGAGQCTIKWNAVSGASSYNVYRATSTTGTYTKLMTVTSTSYVNTGLSTDSTYWYKVSAINSLGTSAQSSAVSVKIAIPGVPTGISTSVTGSSQCTVKWSAVSGAASYDVYRSTTSTGTYTKLATVTGTSYVNSGLTSGATYWYKLSAANTLGTSAQSSAVSVKIAVPGVPAGITTSITGSGQCTVNWSAVSGAASYDVYRATSATGTYTKLATVTSNSYINTGLTSGATYWYKISATNALGASAQSSAVSVKISIPGVPTGITASVTGSSQCSVKWDVVSGTASYNVYRATSATGTYTKLATVTTTSYVNTGLTAGATYWYKVSAANPLGTSAQSSAVSVKIAVPGVPTGITASVTGSGQCTVNWSAVSGAASYDVYRSTTSTGTYTKLATVTTTSYVNSGLTSGATYWYKVSAANTLGTSAQSSAVSVKIAVPGVPAGITTSITSSTQCMVNWSTVSGATSYDVYRATSATGTYTKLGTVTTTSYLNTGLTSGSTYWYRVSAANALGTSAQSSPVSVKIAVPGVPTGIITTITGSGQCTVKWSAVSGASSYNVYRATSATGTYTKLATVTTASYVNTGLTSGSTYWYKVSAANPLGTSAQSSAVSVKIAVPGVPTGIITSITGSGQCTVKWSAVSGAVSYDIYRATSSTGTYTKLATVTTASYADNGLISGSTYWYKVSAVNALGTSAQTSPVSVKIAVPGVPAGITTSITSSTQCIVNWSTVSGAASYDVYRATSATGTYTKLATVTSNSYINTGLTSGATYWYKISATNALGTSAQSIPVSVKIAAPGVPTGIITSITGSGQCTVKWSAVSGASSYNIYRATSATGTYTKLATVTTASYVNTGLTSGSTYWYKVSAINSLGTSAQSSAVSVKIAVPSVPAGITTSVTSSSQCTVKWSAVSGAASYDVYRSTTSTGAYTKLATVTGTSYVNAGLTSGSTYWYKVSAVNALGTSAQSSPVSVKIAVPGVPAGITTSITSSTQCIVNWSNVSGAVSYDVYRATSSAGTYTKLATVTSNSYINTGLTSGATYWYKISATNALGTSAQSSPVSVKIAVPSVPTGIITSITGSGQCTVKWSAVSGASSYDVYRATSATGTYAKLATVTTTSYVNTGLTSGSTYWYKVSAANTLGTSAQSSAVSVKIAVPGVPTGIITSITGSGQCTVKWSAVSGAVSYDVYLATSSTGTYAKLATVTTTSYVNTGLTSGSTYWYKVSAANTLGTSAQSSAVSVKIAVPGVPTGIITSITGSGQCTVKWSAVSGAVSYDVYRATSSTGTYTKLATVTTASYADNGLTSGSTYWYKISAANALGTSAQSGAVSVTIAVPGVPTGIRTSITGSGQCTVYWSAVSGAVSYDVYRATSSTGTYTKLATVTSTSYLNTGLTSGSTYWYKISAANTLGTSAQSSAVSVKIAVPGVPTGITTSITGSGQCTVRWNVVSGAVSYDVYRATSATGTYTKLATVTSSSYLNTGLTPGLTYWYKVSAANVMGTSAQSSTVSVTIPIPVTGITLNQEMITLTEGGATGTITATVSPENATNKTIVWTSSNTNVATVVNGIVTPLAPGTATITATAQTGGFTDTCEVTVNPAAVQVAGISLDEETMTLTAGGATGTITATVSPENATNKNVTWASTNTNVVTVANGIVTPVAAGTATITATTEDGGLSDTCEVTVNPADDEDPDPVAFHGYGIVKDFAEETIFDNAKVRLFTEADTTRTYFFSDILDVVVTKGQIIYYELNENDEIIALDSGGMISADSGLTILSPTEMNMNGTIYNILELVTVFTYDGSAPDASDSNYDIHSIDYIDYGSLISSSVSICLDNGEVIAMLVPESAMEVLPPTGLSGIAPTSADSDTGRITGVDSSMEYKLSTDMDYSPISGNEIPGLAAGTYYVRYAANGSNPAGPYAEVVVPEYVYVAANQYGIVKAFEPESAFDNEKVRLFTADDATRTYYFSDDLDAELMTGQLITYGLDQNGDIGAIASNEAISIDSDFIISEAKTVTISGISYNIPDNAPVFTYTGATPDADTGSYDVTTIDSIALNEYMASPVRIYLNQSTVAALFVPVSLSVETRSIYVADSLLTFFPEGFAPVGAERIYLSGTDSFGNDISNALSLGILKVKNGSDTLILGEDYTVDPAEGLLILEKSYLDTLSDDRYTFEMSILADDGFNMTCTIDIRIYTATPIINYGTADGLTLHVNEYRWDESNPDGGILGASIAPGNIAHVGGPNVIRISADIYDDTYRLKSLIVTAEDDGSTWDITDDIVILNANVLYLPLGNQTINPVTELVPETLPAISGIELYKSYDLGTDTYLDKITSTATGINVNDTIYAKVLFDTAVPGYAPVRYLWQDMQEGGTYSDSLIGYHPFLIDLSHWSERVADNYVRLTISGVDKYSTGEATIEFYVGPDSITDPTPQEMYGVFNSRKSTVNADDDNVYKFTGYIDGEAFTKLTDDRAGEFDDLITFGLYKITVDTNDVITAVEDLTTEFDPDTASGYVVEDAVISDLNSDMTVITDQANVKWTVADDAVVYKWDIDEEQFTLSKLSLLRNGYTVTLYDTKGEDADGIATAVVYFEY